jgi:hypothetical protein
MEVITLDFAIFSTPCRLTVSQHQSKSGTTPVYGLFSPHNNTTLPTDYFDHQPRFTTL